MCIASGEMNHRVLHLFRSILIECESGNQSHTPPFINSWNWAAMIVGACLGIKGKILRDVCHDKSKSADLNRRLKSFGFATS